jgi:hypothetical protein
MTRDKHREYVNNWKKDNDFFLWNALGLEGGPPCKFLTGIFIAPSTSKNQVPILQEVIQADATHTSFGKYTLYSAYATTANGNKSALGFAMLLGNEYKEIGPIFGHSSRRNTPSLTSPILQSSSTRTRDL